MLTTLLSRLEQSRSHRIVWLLEELGLEYKLKLYHRESTKTAEKALCDFSPFGKSPVLEIDYLNGKPSKKVYESGFIIQYIIDHFDYDGKFNKANLTEEQQEEVQYYLHFVEGSLQPFLTFLAVHSVAVERTPFLLRGITSRFVESIDKAYSLQNIDLFCQQLEGELRKNYSLNTSSSQDLFFVANKLSAADIIMIFPLEIIFEGSRVQNLGFEVTKFPMLAKWVSEIKSRVAFKRSYERVEKEGNGQFKIDAF